MNTTKKNYDNLSRWYDLLTFNSEAKMSKIAIQRLDLKPGEIILEIGCGTGSNIMHMAPYIAPSGNIIGLDISTGMLSRARRKASGISLANLIQLVQADGLHLPLCCRKFDVIWMSFTLELFSDHGIRNILAECRRVLIPSGRLCVVGLSRTTGDTFPVRIYDWFHDHFPVLIDCRPILIEQILKIQGYNILSTASFSMFGLPVEIVISNI
ncbi:MAG: methyltransferase domain-containing protein [Anaerolineales bacterium]|nr:methyltransferase domain-containing protein [Anaerolineales bacterium]